MWWNIRQRRLDRDWTSETRLCASKVGGKGHVKPTTGHRYQAYWEHQRQSVTLDVTRHRKPSLLARARRKEWKAGMSGNQQTSWAFSEKGRSFCETERELNELRSPFCPDGAGYTRRHPRDGASASLGHQDPRKLEAAQDLGEWMSRRARPNSAIVVDRRPVSGLRTRRIACGPSLGG